MPKGTEVHVGLFCPQSKHVYDSGTRQWLMRLQDIGQCPTLFACFVLNFSKIFWLWVLEARAAIIAVVARVEVVNPKESKVRGRFERSRGSLLFPFIEDARLNFCRGEGRNLAGPDLGLAVMLHCKCL